MNGPFYVHVAGAWERLAGVQRNPGRTSARPSSETISLGGVRRRQVARRAPRTWALTFPYKDARVVSWLTLAAQGLIGDVYLMDTAAAQVNMLAAEHTIGDPAQPTITVDGHTFAMVRNGHTFTMKCRPGVEYRLSATTNLTAGATVCTYQLGAGTPVTVQAPAGTGSRQVSLLFTPDTDDDVTFAFTRAGASGSSLLRLTEGSVDDLGFLPGQKAVCQVAVEDPVGTIDLITDEHLPMATYTVTLVEVGL